MSYKYVNREQCFIGTVTSFGYIRDTSGIVRLHLALFVERLVMLQSQMHVHRKWVRYPRGIGDILRTSWSFLPIFGHRRVIENF